MFNSVVVESIDMDEPYYDYSATERKGTRTLFNRSVGEPECQTQRGVVPKLLGFQGAPEDLSLRNKDKVNKKIIAKLKSKVKSLEDVIKLMNGQIM